MDSIRAQVARRWRDADPLLPEPGAPQAGCGERLLVTGSDGRPVATGTCEHWECPPGSLEETWGAARRFMLTAQVAGPDVGAGLAGLLDGWREHLAGVPAAAAEDTAAVVTWPSRDVLGVKTLLRHGFAPLGVVAARTLSRRDTECPGGGKLADGVTIRRAELVDADAVAGLGLETVRFDSHFGGVIERPTTLAALRHDAGAWLAGPRPWTWLAERDGEQIGLLLAEQPVAAAWIAPMTAAEPVGYIPLLFVRHKERGSGVGGSLVATAHAEMAAAGAAVSLLHYEQTNPLSVPFWGQQGYRPLWTSWEARPARTMR